MLYILIQKISVEKTTQITLTYYLVQTHYTNGGINRVLLDIIPPPYRSKIKANKCLL